jgi:hypothetical protein
MECKEISKFILQNGMKIKTLPHLFESRSFDPLKTGPCVSSSQLASYWQYYNPEKGVCRPHPLKKGVRWPRPTLSSEALLRDTLQRF